MSRWDCLHFLLTIFLKLWSYCFKWQWWKFLKIRGNDCIFSTDEKEKFEPTVFRDTIVQGLNEAGTDLEAASKFLDITGSRLDYRRYADTLFDILIAGSMLGKYEPDCLINQWLMKRRVWSGQSVNVKVFVFLDVSKHFNSRQAELRMWLIFEMDIRLL